jgi:hypothetical protein
LGCRSSREAGRPTPDPALDCQCCVSHSPGSNPTNPNLQTHKHTG